MYLTFSFPPLTFWASLDTYLAVWQHSSKNYSLAHCAGVELGINFATFNLTIKCLLYRVIDVEYPVVEVCSLTRKFDDLRV